MGQTGELRQSVPRVVFLFSVIFVVMMLFVDMFVFSQYIICWQFPKNCFITACASSTCWMWGPSETPQRTDQSRRTGASTGVLMTTWAGRGASVLGPVPGEPPCRFAPHIHSVDSGAAAGEGLSHTLSQRLSHTLSLKSGSSTCQQMSLRLRVLINEGSRPGPDFCPFYHPKLSMLLVNKRPHRAAPCFWHHFRSMLLLQGLILEFHNTSATNCTLKVQMITVKKNK